MRMMRRLALVVGLALGWLALATAEDKIAPGNAALKVNKTNIAFFTDKHDAATYEYGPELAKPYFWPLNASNGKPVTRSWPMTKAVLGGSVDHPHQKSAWFTYGDVIPEGVKLKRKIKGVEGVDFWSEAPGHGQIACTSVRIDKTVRDGSAVTTINEWRTADGEKIMDEVRKIRLYNYAPSRLFVVDIDLSAGVVPITFGDTKEGAFAVRVADSMREDRGKGRITNAEGKVGEKQCWGQLSAWCDYSGPVEGETVGIAIFADPNNPIPTCWHSRGYGLMGANPFGRKKSGFPAMKDKTDRVHLDKGEHLKLRYALFVHVGDVKEGKVAENYELFKKLK